MPIQPIELYQQQPGTSLIQILQGGSAALTHILDNAVQIGRDVANNRTRQEQDMLAMRAQETSMAQRRAEGLQDTIENAQKLAFQRQDSERRFQAERGDVAWNQQRTSAQDLFGNQMAESRLGLAEREMENREQLTTQRQQEIDAEKARQRAVVASLGQPNTEGSKVSYNEETTWAGPQSVRTESPEFSSLEEASGKAAEARAKGEIAMKFDPSKAAGFFGEAGRGEAYVTKNKPATSRASTVDPEYKENQKVLQGLSIDEKKREAAKAVKEETRNEVSGVVKANPTAFRTGSQQYVDEGLDKIAEKDMTPEQKQRATFLRGWDANQVAAEIYAMQGKTREQYVALGGSKMSDADKKTRALVYDRIMAGTAAPAAGAGGGAVSKIPGI